jgi:hypothetical protein
MVPQKDSIGSGFLLSRFHIFRLSKTTKEHISLNVDLIKKLCNKTIGQQYCADNTVFTFFLFRDSITRALKFYKHLYRYSNKISFI